MAARVTQAYVETLIQGKVPAERVTQAYVEMLVVDFVPPTNSARVTQVFAEVMRRGVPSARISSNYIEVLVANYVEVVYLSGQNGPAAQMMG